MDERRRKFEAQILPHLDAANNLARWLTRDPAAADDIVQDAMLRAFRAFDGLRGVDAKPWLLAIVRNCHRTALDQRRRRAQVPLPEEGEEAVGAMIADGPDPERAAISTNAARRLDAMIARLPEEFRETLVLREMEDMSYREIAEVTGAPIGTVMSRLARARALLREKWLEGGAGDGLQ
jgi:RNA polymerase sigma-70 factor (ECF subfamily)